MCYKPQATGHKLQAKGLQLAACSLQRKNGFTLVEVLASVGILVTFLTAALVSFTSTQNLSEGTQQQAGVLQQAKAKLEEMRAMGFRGLKDWYDDYTDTSGDGNPQPDEYDNRFFNMSNLDAMGSIVLTDVYDGWNQVTPTGSIWTGRYQHTSVVFDNKIWVLGGVDGLFRNDVWWSSDGQTWTQVTPTGSIWTGRVGHTSVVFDNKIWVLGGATPPYLNDVWSSEDGQIWTEVLTNDSTPGPNQWSQRGIHTSVVLDGRIWVLGGFNGSSRLNDVWYSYDGITWRQADTLLTDGLGLNGHTSVSYGGKLWVLGGTSDGIGYRNDVWWSYGADRMYQVDITVSWRQRNGRIVGEDNGGTNGPTSAEALNSILDTGVGEDTNGNGILDSPVHITGLLANRGYPAQIYLGRE